MNIKVLNYGILYSDTSNINNDGYCSRYQYDNMVEMIYKEFEGKYDHDGNPLLEVKYLDRKHERFIDI